MPKSPFFCSISSFSLSWRNFSGSPFSPWPNWSKSEYRFNNDQKDNMSIASFVESSNMRFNLPVWVSFLELSRWYQEIVSSIQQLDKVYRVRPVSQLEHCPLQHWKDYQCVIILHNSKTISSKIHPLLPSCWQSESKELGLCWELSSSWSKPLTDSEQEIKGQS